MWLSVSTPSFRSPDPAVRVARVYAAEGAFLRRGQSLFDLVVDLSAGVVRDCPPVSTCRVVLREDAWLRRLVAAPGDAAAPGEALALLSLEPDSPEATPAREARVATATVLFHEDWCGPAAP